MIGNSILNNIRNYVTGFFTKGHKRTLLAKKNIAASFLIKGLNIAIGLILVPLTIHYLDPTKYGIWITLSSIIGWFGFFDIGLGHGLRNKFAEAIASDNHELAQTYVSTAYAILTLIIAVLLLLFYIVNPFLNWNLILNAREDVILHQELSILVLVVFTFFCLRFVFKLIINILQADQRPAKASLFDLFGKMIALLLIYILTITTEGSLIYLGIIMSSAPGLVLLLSSVWFYSGKYKAYRPSIHMVEFGKAKDLMNLGIKFFFIQIAVVLLYQTNNIIITQLYGPEQVTPYNVVFTYFSILMMGFTIIVTPFWSAITEAWTKQELSWIKNIIQNLNKIWLLLLVIGISMLALSEWVYSVWIGDKVTIPFSMSFLIGAWILINSWNSIYSHFLNGVGKIKLQLYLGIFSAIMNIPLAILLGLKFGINGVFMANIVLVLIGAVVYPIQCKKILDKNAEGIWNS